MVVVRNCFRRICNFSSSLSSSLSLSSSYSTATSTTNLSATETSATPSSLLSFDVSVSDIASVQPENIRNFCTIAHIDHGKSTLSDRIIEIGCSFGRQKKDFRSPVSSRKAAGTILDRLEVERMRGITIKAQSTSILYESGQDGKRYLFNLIDSPGHADFSFEVKRSLMASQGCILLVDALQGIQAQTMNHFFAAFAADKAIIPVINKIDLVQARDGSVADIEESMRSQLDLDGEMVVSGISAKTGLGVSQVLERIIKEIPAPLPHRPAVKSRLHVFDSWFDEFKGIMILVYCENGTFAKGDVIISHESSIPFEILEVGIMYGPVTPFPMPSISTGQVGYLYLNIKDIKNVALGDTMFKCAEVLAQERPKSHVVIKDPVAWKRSLEPLPSIRRAKPMVYAGFFPAESSEQDALDRALKKLLLTDASVSKETEMSDALGMGWRLGFLGSLHMDVFRQRLEQEHKIDSIIITPPTVPYQLSDGSFVSKPADLPDDHRLKVREPTVKATIITSANHIGPMMNFLGGYRGTQTDMNVTNDGQKVIFQYIFPLSEIITGFQDRLLQITSGYASFDYEDNGYEDVKLKKLGILLNGKPADSFLFLVEESSVQAMGRRIVQSLKSNLDRQQYQVAIQAVVLPGTNNIVARETMSAYRKDVTAKCYGGDISRKKKLLEKQKEGKKRLRLIGNVSVPNDAYIALMKDMSSPSNTTSGGGGKTR